MCVIMHSSKIVHCTRRRVGPRWWQHHHWWTSWPEPHAALTTVCYPSFSTSSTRENRSRQYRHFFHSHQLFHNPSWSFLTLHNHIFCRSAILSVIFRQVSIIKPLPTPRLQPSQLQLDTSENCPGNSDDERWIVEWLHLKSHKRELLEARLILRGIRGSSWCLYLVFHHLAQNSHFASE